MVQASDGGSGGWPGHQVMAAAVAMIVLAVGLFAADRTHQLALARRDRSDTAVTATVAAGVVGDLERGLGAVGAAADGLSYLGAPTVSPQVLSTIPGATAVGVVTLDRTAVGAAEPLSLVDWSDPAIAALLDHTRDSGVARAGTAPSLAGDPTLLFVASAYSGGITGTAPRTVTERRTRMLGWVAAVVEPEALAQRYLPPGSVASVRPSSTARDASAPAPFGPLPSQSVEVGDLILVVRAGAPGEPGWGVVAVLVALGSIAAALLAAAGIAAAGRRLRRQRAAIQRGAAQVGLVSAVAPVVQQSLELGEVLPAVAVQLRDHFGLAGVRVSTGSSRADQVELFTLGARPREASSPVLRPPDRVAAGEGLVLALQRGGRSIALLELVAGRDLDASDLRSLSAVTELVTAAVVNASLYASQQAAVRRLRDLDALKTVFLGTASHELRTPATAISGFATLLSKSWDEFGEVERKEFVARIAANARSLGAVVQDLLDLSLLDRGGAPLALVELDLGAAVRALIERLAPLLENHSINSAVASGCTVAGDLNALERVVTNLLTNAAKFAPAGTPITVSVAQQGDGAYVEVSDRGPGVPEEERQRVFVRFYRGSGDAVVQTRGVGIGLSVVADLVERMRGTIALDDAPGGGARFRVWLPAKVLDPAQEEDARATAR